MSPRPQPRRRRIILAAALPEGTPFLRVFYRDYSAIVVNAALGRAERRAAANAGLRGEQPERTLMIEASPLALAVVAADVGGR